MDCDDATLLVAAAEARTLDVNEASKLHDHAEGCSECRQLLAERRDAKMLSIVSIPEDALDDRDMLVLPVVDPSAFIAEGEIARGGMGRIMRARDRRLGRDVAIKETIGGNARARFEREVLITAQLQHPAIIPVYEAGAWPDGSAFYSMRLVSGGTLGDKIDSTKTLAARLGLLRHVIAATDALAFAHSKRIVHRDLKPGNVLVGEFGETVVIDWGLAKELDKDLVDSLPPAPLDARSSDLTMVGSVMGTPGFMSPEQADGEKIDERTDVYALGAILYNLLAGHPPYLDDKSIKSAHALIAAADAGPPTPLAKLAPEAPVDLVAIAERAMARDKAARFLTAKEMADELHRFEAGQLLRSRDYTTRELIARWIRRHRTAVSVAVVAVLVLAVVAIASVRAIVQRKNEVEDALAVSRLEQGRQLLDDGDPGAAAPLLAAAALRLDAPAAHRLADIALRDADRHVATLTGTAVAFSPDGNSLAIGKADGSVDIADAATGTIQRTLAPAGGKVTRVDWGEQIVTASDHGAYLREPQVELSREAGDALIAGTLVVVTTPAGVQVQHLDGQVVSRAAIDGAGSLDLAHDKLLVIGKQEVALFSYPELTRLGTYPQRWWGRIDRDGSVILATDGVLERYAPEVTTLQRGDVQPPERLVDGRLVEANMLIEQTGTRPVTPDTRTIRSIPLDATHLVSGGFDGSMRVWDLERPAGPLAVLAGDAGVDALSAARDRLAEVDIRGHVELWSVAKLRTPAIAARFGGSVGWIAVQGGKIAANVHDDRGDHTTLVGRADSVEGWLVGLTTRGVVADREGRVFVWDGSASHDIADKVWNVAVSPSGTHIATQADNLVAVRDASGAVTATLDTKLHNISSVALDDAGHIVTGHDDGRVRIWTNQTPHEITAHTANVSWIQIRGNRVWTSSWDQTVRGWDLATGAASGGTLTRIRDTVAVSPDGKTLATSERTGFVAVWDAESGALLERIACSGVTTTTAFLDDTHVIAGNSAGVLEVVDIAVPARSDAELRRHEDGLGHAER